MKRMDKHTIGMRAVDPRIKAGAWFALAAALAWACGSGGGTVPIGGGDGGTGSDGAGGGDDGSNPFGDSGNVGQDGGPGGSSLDVQLDGLFGPDGTIITPDSGLGDSGCSPNGISCVGQNPVFAVTCQNGASSSVNCTAQNKLCADGFGCVACLPGTGSCNGNVATRCLPDGSGTVTENCDPLMGLTCQAGVCTGACANIGQSYIGCDYYSVTMVNDQLAQASFPFAISISNTSQQSASVNIVGPGNYNQTLAVAAGAVVTQTLPWVNALSMSAVTSRANASAYHIRSTQPITVYQFNARDYTSGGNFSFTNDASLLLPVNAMSGNYYVTAWPTWRVPVAFGGTTQLPGTVAIIATQANTTVQFTPPAANPVQAGAGITATGTSSVVLNQGDVLQIASALNGAAAGTYGSDMTGSTVVADKPVEVFGGHDCSFVPATVGYCDHLEEVIFPQETLRTDYLVVPPYNSLGTPRAYVKITATTANTTLTYDPAVGGPASLGAGQSATFLASAPFRVTANANHPIIIGMTMLGEDNFQAGNPNAGDPAMSAAVAIEQYRKAYSFFAPPNYAQNWVTVTAAMNSAVTVDGVAVGALTQIGNSGYGYKNVSLCANNSCNGVHSASSAAAFGIQVYGYGSYTSFWYPGGLDLKR